MENKYLLPHELYMETLWHIRGYRRLLAEYNAVVVESPPPPDGLPKGNGTGDPVFAKAAKLEKLHKEIYPIEEALKMIPQEYRVGIFTNILDRVPYPDYANIKTWKLWRQRYVYNVAMLRGRIE